MVAAYPSCIDCLALANLLACRRQNGGRSDITEVDPSTRTAALAPSSAATPVAAI